MHKHRRSNTLDTNLRTGQTLIAEVASMANSDLVAKPLSCHFVDMVDPQVNWLVTMKSHNLP